MINYTICTALLWATLELVEVLAAHNSVDIPHQWAIRLYRKADLVCCAIDVELVGYWCEQTKLDY